MNADRPVIRPIAALLRKLGIGSLIDGQSFLVLGDQAIASANNFLTSVIIGRICSQDEFGLYTLGFSIIIFAATAQSALILSPFSVISPRLDQRERLPYAGSSLAGQLLFSLLAGTALVAASTAASRLLRGVGMKERRPTAAHRSKRSNRTLMRRVYHAGETRQTAPV